jgi:hypothetical protein
MQKIGVIRENTRTQINAVCTDDSLSHQQKLDKIAEVRMSANKERDALVPARQLVAIRQCELARPHRGRLDRKIARSEDPCSGRLPSTSGAAPAGAGDADPDKPTDPNKPDKQPLDGTGSESKN